MGVKLAWKGTFFFPGFHGNLAHIQSLGLSKKSAEGVQELDQGLEGRQEHQCGSPYARGRLLKKCASKRVRGGYPQASIGAWKGVERGYKA